jgi:hypothetical protein
MTRGGGAFLVRLGSDFRGGMGAGAGAGRSVTGAPSSRV